jgi:hypothetical protein
MPSRNPIALCAGAAHTTGQINHVDGGWSV